MSNSERLSAPINIVIAGSRGFTDYVAAEEYLDGILKEILRARAVTILSGCARGADELGEIYAERRGLRVERHPALWDAYGRRAGIIRDREMAEACDMAVCFWDGKSLGTKAMIEFALEAGKPVKIKMVPPVKSDTLRDD